MYILDIEELAVTYTKDRQKIRALKDVSFKVKQGESYGIVGESGSGKSTVLRAICGLAPQSHGSILVGQKPLDASRDFDFYRQVQMVFQDPYASLHPRHTVDHVLSEPLTIHRFDDCEARVARALTDVGLGSDFRFRYPHQLSGGQRQRVAVARALILEPQILLLDEPTSALDASIQAEVLNLLDRLRAERGLTYVLVSHDLSVVAHMCERVMVMQHGLVVEELTRQDLQARRATKVYTKALLAATLGYRADEKEKPQ